ncbi:MAG: alpha/beta hydrolase [Pseudomonadota bacterium]
MTCRFLLLFCVWCIPGVSSADSTHMELDIPYGQHPRQVYDLYVPANPNGQLFILVHGGGWVKGDKSYGDIWPDKLSYWGPLGTSIASVNYRFVPEVTPAEQAADIARAVAQIQQDMRFQTWVLIGHSAGAHLALLLHSDQTLQRQHRVHPWLGTIALDTSAVDVTGIMTKGPYYTWYDVFGRDAERWDDYSPLAKLTVAGAPVLLVCSALRPAPCPQSDLYQHKSLSLGQRVDVVISDKDHLEINSDIGRDRMYTEMFDTWIASLASSHTNPKFDSSEFSD